MKRSKTTVLVIIIGLIFLAGISHPSFGNVTPTEASYYNSTYEWASTIIGLEGIFSTTKVMVYGETTSLSFISWESEAFINLNYTTPIISSMTKQISKQCEIGGFLKTGKNPIGTDTYWGFWVDPSNISESSSFTVNGIIEGFVSFDFTNTFFSFGPSTFDVAETTITVNEKNYDVWAFTNSDYQLFFSKSNGLLVKAVLNYTIEDTPIEQVFEFTKSATIIESRFFMKELAGLPVWSWFVIGGGALLIISLTP
ncbi:MAG: hypothetical protein GF308_00065, partial [Candidatus Heimdallarchaeota archaeon]|nr:hypothetical protein [Candidatus Heimdallarchaeota archaeon]